jgi:hypothetical protein
MRSSTLFRSIFELQCSVRSMNSCAVVFQNCLRRRTTFISQKALQKKWAKWTSMSDDLRNIARAAVVLFGFILIISGFADLANVPLSEQILAVIFGVLGTGLIKIAVGGIFVLAVIYPRAIGDFRNFLKGK